MSHLTFLQLNDLHGYLSPHPEIVRKGDQITFEQLGGLARIAALFQAVRAETGGAVIALDNGDTFHGTHLAVSTKGEALLPMINALEFDAMTLHWEFAYGPDQVRALAAQLEHPMLAINIVDEVSGDLAFEPYRVIERAGHRVGVIGIASSIVDKTMPPAFSEGLRFSIGDEELPHWVEHLRERESVDLVVVLSHLGLPQDVKLAKTVPGIDLILSGHSHDRLREPIVEDGAIIIQSGCHGSFIGRLDLDVEQGRIVRHTHRLIAVDEACGTDERMDRLVKNAIASHDASLRETVGSTLEPLHRYSSLQAPMDDLLLLAIAAAAGTDIAFSNGWRYGVPVPVGPITLEDLWNIIPTNPPVSTVDLTGAEIREMLEEQLEHTYAADPFGQMGGNVKRCLGLTLYLKIQNPAGHRIEEIFAGEDRLEPNRIYHCAFVTEQGVPSKFGKNRTNLSIHAIDALRVWLADHVAGEDARQNVFAI